jgi:hypothetical protein
MESVLVIDSGYERLAGILRPVGQMIGWVLDTRKHGDLACIPYHQPMPNVLAGRRFAPMEELRLQRYSVVARLF